MITDLEKKGYLIIALDREKAGIEKQPLEIEIHKLHKHEVLGLIEMLRNNIINDRYDGRSFGGVLADIEEAIKQRNENTKDVS